MIMRRLVSFLFVVSSCATIASAQIRVQSSGGSFQTPGLAQTGSAYLMVPAVQKELKISPAVAAKITKAYQDGMQMMMPPKGATKEAGDRRQAFQQGYKALLNNQSKIVAMLNPAQKSRLRQITIQQLGARGMLHPEVKPGLKLTADQDRKINAIVRDGSQMMFKGFQGGTGKTSPSEMQARMKDFQAQQKEWRTKMLNLSLKVLTPAQRSQWQTLCGKPFTFDFSFRTAGVPTVRRG